MSFSEDVDRFGDQLIQLVDAGVAVREAAAALGITRQRLPPHSAPRPRTQPRSTAKLSCYVR
jgi:hypothetical protein